MVNISRKFMQQLYNDQRNYLVRVVINLADTNQTVLTLTNENIWDFSPTIDDAVSSDEDLQVGTAIINKFSFTINNIYETYSQYDFKDAKVFLTVGLDIGDDTVERIKKGTFYVDTADYNDTFITLECLDGMHKFEKPFKANTITFPTTAGYIVSSICTTCGVILDTTSFPNKDYIITSAPDKDTCTYREVLAWIAQICGCFARFNSEGHLELKWYDRTSLETVIDGLDGGVFDVTTLPSYQTGDTANGGSFNPWNTGDVYDSGDFTDMIKNVHFINTAYSHTMSVDDVVITGVRILVKTKDVVDSETGAVTNTDVISTHFQGTEGYIIEISENPFITEDNVNVIISYLGTQLIGLRFRKANLSVPSDPSIEAGDVAIYWDRKGIYHPILVSRTTFITGDAQTIVSSAQTPARNSAERYSAETKNYVAVRKQIREEKNARQLMFDDFQEQMAHASGMYCTEVEDEETHAVTTYYHNKQLLEDSDIQIVISDVGISVTNTGTAETPTWYGLEVDGDYIAHILSAEGINADWINAGLVDGQYINAKNLSVSDNNGNRTFYIDGNGNVELRPTTFLLSGKTVNTIADEVASGKGYQTANDVRTILENFSFDDGNLLKDAKGLTEDYWNLHYWTISRGIADPDGGTNAVVITPRSNDEAFIQARTDVNNPFSVVGLKYYFSVWLKASNSNCTSNPIRLHLNDVASEDIYITTEWKEYNMSVTVDSIATDGSSDPSDPFSDGESFAENLVTIGGNSSFTSSDGFDLYVYNPRVGVAMSTAEFFYKAFGSSVGLVINNDGRVYIGADAISVTDLYALGATIGGFTIDATAIRSGPLDGQSSGNIALSTEPFSRFVNGQNVINNLKFAIGVNFAVTSSGILYANNANFSGNLTAENITTDHWIIDGDGIRPNPNAPEITSGQISATSQIKLGFIEFDATIRNTSRTDLVCKFGRNFGIDSYGRIYAESFTGDNVYADGYCKINKMHFYNTHYFSSSSSKSHFNDSTAGIICESNYNFGTTGSIYSGGNLYSINGTCTGSDERIKNIYSNLDKKYLDLFMAIKPIVFNWKDSEDNHFHFGIGAQTFQRDSGELGYQNLGIVDDNNPDLLTVNYSELLMLSVPVVQEHEKKIMKLEAENKALKKQIDDLETRLARLEAIINRKEGETKR